MADKILMRRDTLANWDAANPVLGDGEIGYIKDWTRSDDQHRVGDGVSTWKELEPKASLEVALEYDTILFIGASITNWTYQPKLVKDMVDTRYGRDVTVHNIAVAGFTANDLYEYIQGNEIEISSTGVMVDPMVAKVDSSDPAIDNKTSVYDLLVNVDHEHYLPNNGRVLVVMHIGGNDVSSGDSLKDGTELVTGRPFSVDKAPHFMTHIKGIYNLLDQKNPLWEFCMLDMSYRDYETDIRSFDVGAEKATAWRREDLGSAPYNEFIYKPLVLELSPRFAISSGENCMQNYMFSYNNWQMLNKNDKVHPENDGRELTRRRFLDTVMLANYKNIKGQVLTKSLEKYPPLEEQYYNVSFGFTAYVTSFISTVAGYINYGGATPRFSSGMVYTHILKSKNIATRDSRITGVDMILRYFQGFSHKEDLIADADKGGKVSGNMGYLRDEQMQSCLYWLSSGVPKYTDDSVNTGETVVNPQIEFQNLDVNQTYFIRIAGSRIPTGSEGVTYENSVTIINGTVEGSVEDRLGEVEAGVSGLMRSKIYDGGGMYPNHQEGIRFNGVRPDANGTVTLELELVSGGVGYVNGLDLVAEKGDFARIVALA